MTSLDSLIKSCEDNTHSEFNHGFFLTKPESLVFPSVKSATTAVSNRNECLESISRACSIKGTGISSAAIAIDDVTEKTKLAFPALLKRS